MKRDLRRRSYQDIELVKTILRRWDPIGVFPDRNGSPAFDEYDSYAPQLLLMLNSGASKIAIASRLEDIRTRDMGLPLLRLRDEETAEELVALGLTTKADGHRSGPVAVESEPIPDGSIVPAPEADESFELDATAEAELLLSTAESYRGELISAEDVLRTFRDND